MLCFNVGFEIEPHTFAVGLDTDDMVLSVDFGTLTVLDPADAETYKGAYTVDPEFEAQTLATKDKRMSDNVTVNAIEVQRVSNTAGGRTVYIGGLIDG